ncbi:L-threonate dehydrogenase [Bradyrhizobium oligotrophicum S58]
MASRIAVSATGLSSHVAVLTLCLTLWQRGQAVIPRVQSGTTGRLRETLQGICRMPSPSQLKVAVIGLGSMGYGMATSLKRAGFEVTGCDVSADAVARFVADGGKGAASPADAARGADIVVSVVVNAAQTEAVLFGPGGAAETMPKDSVFVSSATMDPDVARRLAKQLEATGRHYLDAPISGGAQRAAQGELTILASGSAAAFAKARPALDAMAAKLYELGDAAGQGAAFKMINQLLAGVHIAAASEAIAFAAKQGLDIRKVYEVITASAGNSWMFENRMPHVLDGDYTPRSAVEIFVKDLGIIQDMARSHRFPVPVSAAALQMFLMTSAAGMGRDDDASVARMYAQVTGTTLPGSSKS